MRGFIGLIAGLAMLAPMTARAQPKTGDDIAIVQEAVPSAVYRLRVPKSPERIAAERAEARRDQIEAMGLVTNIALAVFALLQVVAAFFTLRGLKHAKVAANAAEAAANAASANIEHLRVIERAYMFAGIADITSDPTTSTTQFKLMLHNDGRTPGRIRELRVGISNQIPQPQTWPIVPDYSAALRHETDTIFGAGERQPVNDGYKIGPMGIVYGYVIYEDIFQIQHQSRFCIIVDGIAKAASTFGNDAWNEYD